MWAGLHRLWDVFGGWYLASQDIRWSPGLWDTREEAYHLAMISYCALFDIDPAYRNTCKSQISASFPALWTPAKFPDGSWPQLYYSYGASSWATGTSVTLTQGSPTVTGNGTNWTASMFNTCLSNGTGPCPMWFTTAAATRPLSNADGDSIVYYPVFVDSTHLVLKDIDGNTVPYPGATGIHGWALTDNNNADMLGWGAQPFMMGILSSAFDLAAKAIADTDVTNSNLAHDYNVISANWIRTNGYQASTKGLYYGSGMVNCQPPIPNTAPACLSGGPRVLNAEAVRGVMAAYAYTQDPALKDFADTLYSAMFSKPGTGGPNPDGQYVDALDDGGFYMSGEPPIGASPKYFGMFFGFSSLAAWPAGRAGGLQPASSMNVYVGFNMALHPGATRLRVTAMGTDGQSHQAECANAPCVVSVDRRFGGAPLKLEYLADNGRVLGVATIRGVSGN